MADAAEPIGGPRNWGNAWLPATFQGTPFRPDGHQIHCISPPKSVTDARQKAKLDLIADLDLKHAESRSDDTRLAARIASYELAYRMQSTAPEAVDLSRETERRRRRRRCMGSMTRSAASSARCAFGLADWSSAACGSCSSTADRAASGTRTETWKEITGVSALAATSLVAVARSPI